MSVVVGLDPLDRPIVALEDGRRISATVRDLFGDLPKFSFWQVQYGSDGQSRQGAAYPFARDYDEAVTRAEELLSQSGYEAQEFIIASRTDVHRYLSAEQWGITREGVDIIERK